MESEAATLGLAGQVSHDAAIVCGGQSGEGKQVEILDSYVQCSAKLLFPGLVNFVPAVAHHFCPSLPAAFTQPRAST